jgi:hypothetical protein
LFGVDSSKYVTYDLLHYFLLANVDMTSMIYAATDWDPWFRKQLTKAYTLVSTQILPQSKALAR